MKRKVIIPALGLAMVLLGACSNNKTKSSAENLASASDTANAEPQKKKANTAFKGEVLHTQQYDIIVDSLELLPKIKGQFETNDPGPEAGYLVVHVTYKNTSSSNISPMAGSLVINSGNDWLEYSEVELIAEKGWTVFTTSIGPGLTEHIKYAYKIPRSTKGTIMYLPEKDIPTQMIVSGEM